MSFVKKIFKVAFFPHISFVLFILPISVTLLVYSFAFEKGGDVLSYISYFLSAYTLTVLCIKTPYLINGFKNFKENNGLAVRLRSDVNLRASVLLWGTLFFNTGYAIFQLGLGLYHSSVWYYAMAVYYFLLAVMRFFLLKYMRTHAPGGDMRAELRRYSASGFALLVMNLALGVIIIFIVIQGRTFVHHEITTIAIAAYTFTTFSFAIVNAVRYRKYNSPVLSSSKIINLICASVSVLTMEATMLTTFGDSSNEGFRQIMLGATGLAVSVLTVTMAIFMIVRASVRLKELRINDSKKQTNYFNDISA